MPLSPAFRDRPLRWKLVLAFVAVVLTPLLILGGWSAWDLASSGAAVAEATLEDRLRIASLLWEVLEDDLEGDALTLSRDNSVIMNLDLGLHEPLPPLLEEFRSREGLEGAFILDRHGAVLGLAGEASLLEELPSGIPGSLIGMGSLLRLTAPGGAGPPAGESPGFRFLAFERILSYQDRELGWAVTTRVLGQGSGPASRSFLEDLDRQIGLPHLIYVQGEGEAGIAGDPALAAVEGEAELPGQSARLRGGDGEGFRVRAISLGPVMGITRAPLPLRLAIGYPEKRILAQLLLSLRNQATILILAFGAAFFLGLRLSSALLRPIHALTAGAQTIGGGRFELRVPVESLDEIGILAGEFNLMTERLATSLGELSREVRAHEEAEARIRSLNAELQAANAGLEAKVGERTSMLESSLAELRAAQDRLIAAERYAVSNRLSARLAHELNTPLGAALSAADSLAERLTVLIPELPDFAAGLSAEERRLFTRVLDHGLARAGNPGHRPGGALSQMELAARLEGWGLSDPMGLAASLAELGFPLEGGELEGLGRLARAPDILQKAAEICEARRMAAVVRVAGERAAEVVKALRGSLEVESAEESLFGSPPSPSRQAPHFPPS